MDGLLRCTHYAFGPNRLHYCGPDASQEILAHMQNKASNPGLESMLKLFQTMYPYLRHIAWNNNIKDPFDERVVEAYWIGNELLDNIEKKKFYRYLIDDQKIKDKINSKSFNEVVNKLKSGVLPHHSFHVFHMWKPKDSIEELIRNIDSCRVSCGAVRSIDGPTLSVETEPLIYKNRQFTFGQTVVKNITRGLDANYEIEQLKIGDIITLHWNVPCEVITSAQAENLKKYTWKHMRMATLEN